MAPTSPRTQRCRNGQTPGELLHRLDGVCACVCGLNGHWAEGLMPSVRGRSAALLASARDGGGADRM